ncbi:MAG: NrtA/SsuA/CpmA family ABC transporter substrate-binding protein [Nitrospirae bacterium]|nr:NrtA/SsuA/CpmA family ABC transporter substrate-binding protein [Nitrospirota bacterium]
MIKINKRKSLRLLVFIIILVLSSVFSSQFVGKKQGNSLSGVTTPGHTYQGYVFEKGDKIVGLGTQPLYLPAVLITECMKRDGLLRKSLESIGLQIRFYPFLKGDDVNYALKNGDISAGIAGDMPAINAAANIGVVIGALTQLGFTSIISRNYITLSDMKGKRIGYVHGSNAHYTLLKVLREAQLSEHDVNLIPMDITEMPASLEKGEIDAFSAWEPTTTLALKRHPEDVIIYQQISYGYIYFSKEFYEKHPDAVSFILASEIRSLRWMNKSKQNLLYASKWAVNEIGKFVKRDMDITVGEIARVSMNDIIGMTTLPYIPVNELKDNAMIYEEFHYLKKINEIPSFVQWDKVRNSFDSSALDRVIENPDAYKYNVYAYDPADTK